MTERESVTVRVRGIYATALTERLREAEGVTVVQASPPIQRRFENTFGEGSADVTIEIDDQRLGASVVGIQAGVGRVRDALDVAIDTLGWADPTPRGAIFDGVVTETLGSGAVVDLGESEGFLPFNATSAHVESDDRVRVQVTEPAAPWSNDRPALDTTLAVRGDLATLVREEPTDVVGPDLLDVLSVDVPAGWRVSWDRDADDAHRNARGDGDAGRNARSDGDAGRHSCWHRDAGGDPDARWNRDADGGDHRCRREWLRRPLASGWVLAGVRAAGGARSRYRRRPHSAVTTAVSDSIRRCVRPLNRA